MTFYGQLDKSSAFVEQICFLTVKTTGMVSQPLSILVEILDIKNNKVEVKPVAGDNTSVWVALGELFVRESDKGVNL